jgi:hypothetical protein
VLLHEEAMKRKLVAAILTVITLGCLVNPAADTRQIP